MKILYVAKHDSGDNDDEGAIAHALTSLGHEVDRVHEMRRHRDGRFAFAHTDQYDFCLFHKWPTPSEIADVKCPSVFWYFDMVRPVDGDPTLTARSAYRTEWMRDVLALPNVVLGFCTDGDWVDSDPLRSGKLRWLMQGADERTLGLGTPIPGYDGPEILFTGMVNHGERRARHVAHLQEQFRDRFGVVGDGGPRHRRHGRDLADLFASAKVVVAPDGPNTDRYWSNRVYLSTGLGAYLVHPRCAGVESQYRNVIPMYSTWDQCDTLIEIALSLSDPTWRSLREMALAHTTAHHLYRHRCEELVRQIRERIQR